MLEILLVNFLHYTLQYSLKFIIKTVNTLIKIVLCFHSFIPRIFWTTKKQKGALIQKLIVKYYQIIRMNEKENFIFIAIFVGNRRKVCVTHWPLGQIKAVFNQSKFPAEECVTLSHWLMNKITECVTNGNA